MIFAALKSFGIESGHKSGGVSKMKRIAIWALPLVLIATFAAQGFAQAAAQEQPKFKDTGEYTDFMAVFNEKDFAKKAANAATATVCR